MNPSHTTSALIVENDLDDLRSLRQSFAELRFELVEVGSIQDALCVLDTTTPDLVISELRLPDGSGFALCRHVRERSEDGTVPILLTSRWCSESDRILAFECGADDFIAKPIFPRELTSRIRAVMRRAGANYGAQPANTNDSKSVLEVDSSTHTVTCAGRNIALTPTEFQVLAVLARKPGRVLSRAELIESAWAGTSQPSTRSVDTHVKALRSKLGSIGNLIETVRGVGYRIKDEIPLE